MAMIDYKRVKCPKCGKSYFRVKENSGVSFTTLAFIIKPDPIYKDDEWFKNHQVKNEEVEQADRVLTNACNKFAKRAENYENQIKQLRTENKELRKTITEKGEEVFLFTEKDLQIRIKKEREAAVFNFINRVRFDLGQTYGIDKQLNELTLEDIMENIRNVYKEVYKK